MTQSQHTANAEYDTGLAIIKGGFNRGGARILTAIDLEVPPGSIVILRGENGAGKTTLLRCCAGLLLFTSGSVQVTASDESSSDGGVQNLAAFYGHENGLKAALSVRDNMRFWARLYKADRKTVEHACERFNLTQFLERPAHTLSAGQRRRLGLSRLLICQKPIWLLDEPTSSMDERGVDLFKTVIADHASKGGSAIIATHDPLNIERARTVVLSAAGGDGS